MAGNKRCVLCESVLTEAEPAILTVGAYGNPKCLCAECQGLLDTATLGREYDEIADAMERLGKKMAEATPDKQSYEIVSDILLSAADRAKKIRTGEYDFSLDEVDEELDELPEELLESEEDIEKDKRDEERAKRFDKVFNYVTIGVFAAAAVLILVKIITSLLG